MGNFYFEGRASFEKTSFQKNILSRSFYFLETKNMNKYFGFKTFGVVG